MVAKVVDCYRSSSARSNSAGGCPLAEMLQVVVHQQSSFSTVVERPGI